MLATFYVVSIELYIYIHIHIYIYTCACLAQWIGCVTPNVASAGSTPPKVETKNYNWVAPSWLVYSLHVSHCLFECI